MSADPITEFLTQEAEHWRSRFPEWRFGGLAGLLLEHGRRFERGDPPRRRGGWNRTQKACFRNAYLNASEDPDRFVYCEGYCWDDSFNFQHAWFVERRAPNLALDTTLRRDEDHEYYGVPLRWAYVRDKVMAGWSQGGEAYVGSILEGGMPWPPGGPPTLASTRPSLFSSGYEDRAARRRGRRGAPTGSSASLAVQARARRLTSSGQEARSCHGSCFIRGGNFCRAVTAAPGPLSTGRSPAGT